MSEGGDFRVAAFALSWHDGPLLAQAFTKERPMNHRSLALIFLVVLVSTAARAQQPDLVFHSLGQDSREQIHITWHSHGDADRRCQAARAGDVHRLIH